MMGEKNLDLVDYCDTQDTELWSWQPTGDWLFPCLLIDPVCLN